MKTILLIDDDELVLRSLERALRKAGYEVFAFQDPREAIRQAAIDDFDLVITDMRMPHIDGHQTLKYVREIRKSKNKSDIPEIVITGYAGESAKILDQAETPTVIFKPIDINEFLAIVKAAF